MTPQLAVSIVNYRTPEMTIAVTSTNCVQDVVTLTPVFDYFGQGVFDYTWEFGDGDSLIPPSPDVPVEHVYSQSYQP